MKQRFNWIRVLLQQNVSPMTASIALGSFGVCIAVAISLDAVFAAWMVVLFMTSGILLALGRDVRSPPGNRHARHFALLPFALILTFMAIVSRTAFAYCLLVAVTALPAMLIVFCTIHLVFSLFRQVKSRRKAE